MLLPDSASASSSPSGIPRALGGVAIPVAVLIASCAPDPGMPPAPIVQDGPGFYQELSWAPDGESLLVSVLEISDADPGFEYRIWRVWTSSGEALAVSPGPRDYWTSWAPDGERVAFAADGAAGGLDIFVMQADGSNRRPLTTDPAGDTQPAWSPDGERIAFVSDRTGRAQLWIMDDDGTEARQLAESEGEVQNPEWSPDGVRIAYYETDSAGRDRIAVIGADGAGPTWVADGLWPIWTPSGDGLLFGGEGGLYRVSPAGGAPIRLVPGDVLTGALSPDGRHLAYILQEGESVSIVVSSAQGGDPRTVMTRPAPAW